MHGLLHSASWDEGLGKISETDKRYIKACLRKGESLTSEPRIRTYIPCSKQKDTATNVMMLTDTIRRVVCYVEKNF